MFAFTVHYIVPNVSVHVQRVVESLFTDLADVTADVLYMGSSYELTALPGVSDYDLQYCVKVSGHRAAVEECSRPDWRRIKGGPPNLLDSTGYLSAYKANA